MTQTMFKSKWGRPSAELAALGQRIGLALDREGETSSLIGVVLVT